MKRTAIFVGALILLELFSFGLQVHQRGFYHDDWVHLEYLSSMAPDSFIDAFRVHLPRGHWSRPVLMLFIPFFYALGGLNPLPYQAGMLLLECITGILLFIALRAATRETAASWIAAAVFLIYPNRACTHFWWIVSVSSLSTALLAAAFCFHILGVKRRGRPYALPAALCYLTALLTYEATMGWIVWLAVYEYWRRHDDSGQARALNALRALTPYLAAFAVLFLHQRVLVPALLPDSFAKLMHFSARHVIWTFAKAAHCMTTGPLWLSLKSLADAAAFMSLGKGALLAAAAAAAAYALHHAPPVKSPRRTAPLFIGGGVLMFFAAYAPYAASGNYAPDMLSLMNRLNTGGAFAAGLVAAGLYLLLTVRVRTAVFTTALVLATTANWHASQEWTESWTLQQRVVGRVRPHLAAIPEERAVLLLAGVPNMIGTAIVFDSYWDFDRMLKTASGRKSLQANIMSHRITHDPQEVREESGGQVLQRYPYTNLWIYRYDLDRLLPVTSEEEFAAALPPT
ncbi:MAG: hypothetical protein ABIJ96_02915 [Elusimicrobiota bacterium]